MGRSGTRSRSRGSIPMAPPARRREKAGKLYLPAVQRMGSDRKRPRLNWRLHEIHGRSGNVEHEDERIRSVGLALPAFSSALPPDGPTAISINSCHSIITPAEAAAGRLNWCWPRWNEEPCSQSALSHLRSLKGGDELESLLSQLTDCGSLVLTPNTQIIRNARSEAHSYASSGFRSAH